MSTARFTYGGWGGNWWGKEEGKEEGTEEGKEEGKKEGMGRKREGDGRIMKGTDGSELGSHLDVEDGAHAARPEELASTGTSRVRGNGRRYKKRQVRQQLK